MNPSTPALVVAIFTLVIICLWGTIAMFRYPIDDVLKIMGIIGTLFGAVLGSIGTYYFTSQTTAQAEQRALAAEAQVQQLASSPAIAQRSPGRPATDSVNDGGRTGL